MTKSFLVGAICGATVTILAAIGVILMDKDLVIVEDTVTEDDE